MEMFDTPLLFIIFNRPDTTAQVFVEIKKLKPRRLFVFGDGPRINKQHDKESCFAARRVVLDNIDWECDIKVLFHDDNLGCKKSVSSAVSWFFGSVEEGIILEDDCVPDQTFFIFCKELLRKYRNDSRIMHIGGSNYQNGIQRGDGSYYFSKYSHIWGWATWRRSWKYYDVSMKTFPDFVDKKIINNIIYRMKIQKYWLKIFKIVYENKLNTWDYQWLYTIWCQGGLSVVPNCNLVKNVGFGEEATHTRSKSMFANMLANKTGEIVDPTFVIADMKADRHYEKNLVFFYRLINKVKIYLKWL